jgi:4-amino-4-deoxy-L-arabinose transferase-like glycosyltransferase
LALDVFSGRSLMPKPAHLLLLFFVAVFLHSLGNSTLPLIDRDEPRFAEASREMQQSGDYLIPRINGDYRFDKPPLIYWCQAASYNLLDDNDFAARLPSVLFAALTGVATAMWGGRIYGPKTGLCAGLMFTVCLQVFIHARAAVADMPMVFFFVTAAWADWERLRTPRIKDAGATGTSRQRLLWWAFYFSLAFGFLAKGPIALLPILFSPILAIVARRSFRPGLGSSLGGLAVILIVVGAWGVPALIATQGQFFEVGIGKHVVGRSFAAMEHHGGSGWLEYLLFLPYYFITLFISFFPWCFFVPKTIARLRTHMNSDENYLLIAVILVFGVFSLVQTKLPHYTLPCYPMLAILVARTVGHNRIFKPLLAATTILFTIIALPGFRFIEPFFISKSVGLAALPMITPETRTGSLNYDEQSLIWYLRKKTRPFHVRLDSNEFEPFMNAPGPAMCVVNSESLAKIKIDPSWQSFAVSGYNFARWKLQPRTLLGIHASIPCPQPLDLVTFIKTGNRK